MGQGDDENGPMGSEGAAGPNFSRKKVMLTTLESPDQNK